MNGVGEGRGVIMAFNYSHNTTDVLRPLVSQLLMNMIVGPRLLGNKMDEKMKIICVSGESNPGLPRGRLLFYH